MKGRTDDVLAIIYMLLTLLLLYRPLLEAGILSSRGVEEKFLVQ